MEEIILDLSGSSGLISGFSGDSDMVTPRPELFLSKDGDEFASGYFNPYLRNGYLAPVITTSTSITTTGTPLSNYVALEYDILNNEVIGIDDTNNIFKLSSLTDTSFELVEQLGETNEFGTFTYDELYDAQIYEMNGVRRLYVVGKSLPYGGMSLEYGYSSGEKSLITTFAVNPSSSTQPTIVYSKREFTASPGTSKAMSVTVPSGTNTCLFVVCFFSNAYNPAYIYSYGDTATLDQLGEAGSLVGPGYIASYLVNPVAGTYNVEVAGPAGGFTNLTMIAFVTNNTNQTSPVSFEDTIIDGQVLTGITNYVNSKQLSVVAMYSNGVISLDDSFSEEEGAVNAYGSDILAKTTDVQGSGLMIGSLSLPVSTNGSSFETWLSSKVVNSFYQELSRDYAFMRVADNGFAYVFSDNHVHKIDGSITGGTNGIITKDVLLFPSYFTITDAVDYRSNLYLAVHQYPVTTQTTSLSTYSGRCGVYVWNRVSTKLSNSDYIELPGVREIKKIYASPDGVIKLITISDSGLTELRQFGYNDSGGVVFPVVKKLGIGAYPQIPRGATTAGDKYIWLANDGNLYSERGNKVIKLFQVKTPATTSTGLANNIKSGAVLFGSGDETAGSGFRSNKQAITFSYIDSATNLTKKIYPFDLKNGSDAAQSAGQGDVYTCVKFMPEHSVVRNVRVYNAPVSGTGTTVIATVKLYFNQSSTVGMTKTITKDEARRGYVDFHINKPYIHAVQIEIEWSTSITLDGDIYLPSVAIISHEATKGQSPDNG